MKLEIIEIISRLDWELMERSCWKRSSIKKFALKGNAKKDELYEALINFKESETNLENFSNILEANKTEWITPAKAVNKPIDDIVDATWITLYLKKELKEIYGIKGNFEQELATSL